MGLRDRLDLGDRGERRLVRILQIVLIGTVLVGLYRRQVSIVVNAGVSLAITFVPGLIEREWDLTVDPVIVLCITVAVTVHAVGVLGPYRQFAWYDQVAHALSATIVAGVGYATARAIDEHTDAVAFPPRFLFVYVLLFTVALGVLWEVLEFAVHGLSDYVGVDAVLVQYSLEDTIVDLVFDLVGAILVALFGTTTLRSVVDTLTARFAGGSSDELQ